MTRILRARLGEVLVAHDLITVDALLGISTQGRKRLDQLLRSGSGLAGKGIIGRRTSLE